MISGETKALIVGSLAMLIFAAGFLYTHPVQTNIESASVAAAPAISAIVKKATVPARTLTATTAPAKAEVRPAATQEAEPLQAMAAPVILAESVDSRGITHHFVQQDETLCKIAKRQYGDTKAAINLAWLNGVDRPNVIVVGQEILLPANVAEIPLAPSSWPEVRATLEQIASRSRLVPLATEDAASDVNVLTPSIETVPAIQPPAIEIPSLTTCATRQHVVVEGEVTYWDVVRNEYQLDPGLAPNPDNSMNRSVHLGEELTIPCLEEIWPNVPTIVGYCLQEGGRPIMTRKSRDDLDADSDNVLTSKDKRRADDIGDVRKYGGDLDANSDNVLTGRNVLWYRGSCKIAWSPFLHLRRV